MVDLPLPVRELLFTVRRAIVDWYWNYCLLVGELLLTGTGAVVYWYAS